MGGKERKNKGKEKGTREGRKLGKMKGRREGRREGEGKEGREEGRKADLFERPKGWRKRGGLAKIRQDMQGRNKGTDG